MSRDFVFTSESVSEGHPDKVADRISDGVLDAILTQDKYARVACETLVTTGMALIAGEITTSAVIDYQNIVRGAIKEIGYNSSSMGFDWESCAVLVTLDKQSPDIAMGVNEGEGIDLDQGAGDQGRLQVGHDDVEQGAPFGGAEVLGGVLQLAVEAGQARPDDHRDEG